VNKFTTKPTPSIKALLFVIFTFGAGMIGSLATYFTSLVVFVSISLTGGGVYSSTTSISSV
jgi:hypothetical protein